MKNRSLLLLIICILTLLLLSGCESKKSNEMVGKWKNVYTNQIWTFMEDGYLERDGTYSYSFYNNSSLKIFWSIGSIEVQEYEVNFTYDSDDTMVNLRNIETGDIISLILIEKY